METNLDRMYKTDKNLEENQGVFFQVDEGVGFYLKRFGGFNTTKTKQAYSKYAKPYARQIQKDTIDAKTERKIYINIFIIM